MKEYLKKLWRRAYKCVSRNHVHSSYHTCQTWESLLEGYHRDPKDFPSIKENDDLFKRWVENVVFYDDGVSSIMEYRLNGVPFEEYFENGIPFSQVLILLQGVLEEYSFRGGDAPLEYDLLDYLEAYPVSQENFDLLLQEIDRIDPVTKRVSLRAKIKKIKEKQAQPPSGTKHVS